MLQALGSIFLESWLIFLASSPFMLLGFLAAGLIKAFVPDRIIVRHLGGKSSTAVLKASLFGIPLPLCSCAVVPAAMGLYQQGAGKGPVTAFLISTPETGADSIAVTYALLDPFMTVIRPVSAFITATVAGLLVNFIPDRRSKVVDSGKAPKSKPEAEKSCTPDSLKNHQISSGPDALGTRVTSGLKYSLNRLLPDIGPWFLLGVVLAGIISFFVPQDFIIEHLGRGVLPLVIMLVLATPLYVCATASTPVVAALALKGLSPGAALVFLLAGPATNLVTITILVRLLGLGTTLIYLGTIVFSALVMGLTVDWIYVLTGMDIANWAARALEEEKGWGYLTSAALLMGLMLYSLGKRAGFKV